MYRRSSIETTLVAVVVTGWWEGSPVVVRFGWRTPCTAGQGYDAGYDDQCRQFHLKQERKGNL